jgi:hypothetical protein
MCATIDRQKIERIVSAFPNGDQWQSLKCSAFVAHPEKGPASQRTWKKLDDKKIGAVYAFLLPHSLFRTEKMIHLYGRRHRGNPTLIPFRFVAEKLHGTNMMVAYVGRTANLWQRIQWHFSSDTINTAGQVQYGLCDSRICRKRAAAQWLMLQEAQILYHILRDDAETANRDMIEVSLIAKYFPPFNIKAER